MGNRPPRTSQNLTFQRAPESKKTSDANRPRVEKSVDVRAVETGLYGREFHRPDTPSGLTRAVEAPAFGDTRGGDNGRDYAVYSAPKKRCPHES